MFREQVNIACHTNWRQNPIEIIERHEDNNGNRPFYFVSKTESTQRFHWCRNILVLVKFICALSLAGYKSWFYEILKYSCH